MLPKLLLVDAATKREEVREKAVQSIKDSFPFKGERFTVEVEDVAVKPGDFSTSQHKDALMRARTMSEPIRGTLLLRDNKTGKVVQRVPKFNLLQLPYMTEQHTFVLGGNTYAVGNQLRMKPGVYTRKRRNADLEATFNLSKGDNFRIGMDREKGLFNMEYGATKIPLYSVLNKLGVSDAAMTKSWNPALLKKNRDAFAKGSDRHIDRLYEKIIRPLARVAGEDKLEAVRTAYSNTSMDPRVTKRTLGTSFDKVNPEVLLSASNKLLRVYNDPNDFDERDNLAFKRIKSVDDFIGERIKLESRALRNKVLSKIERGKSGLEAVPNSPFTKSIRQFLSTSALSGNPDQINPMEILDQAVRVTSLGEGGISSTRAVPEEAQRLHSSHIGVIDPIRTPESDKIGIDLRTAILTARDADGDMYTVLRDNKTNRNKYVAVEDMVDKIIAFPGQKKSGNIDVISQDRIQSMPYSKVDYTFPTTHSMYSPAGNLIPFQDSTDGNRQTMASKMMTQALPLKYSEVPLVQVQGYSAGGKTRSMEKELGSLMVPVSSIDGEVTDIKDGFIYVRSRHKTAAEGPIKIPYFENFPLASKTYLHHDLKIKKGDSVTSGQVLADSPFVKDGTLTLGTNLTTAYIPLRGQNSNDAIVISESAAKKLTSQHMYRTGLDLDADSSVNQTKHKAYYGVKYDKSQYDKLDEEGVVKPGMKVNKGDLLISSLQKSSLSPEAQMLGKLHKSLVKPYKDNAVVWDHDTEGTVVDVAKAGRKIRMTIKTDVPMEIGSKIAGRYGNKGVISSIIPDDQMIQDESGNPIDVAISSSSVVSRINPSQVLETALAKVAKKTGKPIAVENYVDRDNVKWVKGLLKENGLSDTETIFDPVSGKKIKNVLVGPQYTFKLFKTTDTNYSARGVEGHDVDQQPSGGGSKGAKGVGRLFFNALLAHDARNILKESAVLKSQKNDNWWRAYQLGLPLPHLKTTFAYDKFGAMLAGAGVKMNKSDDNISLGPLTDSDVTKMSQGEVKNSLFVRAKDLRPERGGLFDPVVTGGSTGTKWSYVNLQEPTVNPIFERPVRTMLGMTQKEFIGTLRKEGGQGVSKRLAKIDLPAREEELRKALPSMKSTARDNAIKELKYVKSLRRNDMTPDKAWMTSKLPVVPPIFRPIIPGKRGDLQVNDANFLYRDAMLANDALKSVQNMPGEIKGQAREHLYDSVSALYGVGEPVSPQLKARGVKGFINRIAGTGVGPKHGFFQKKLVKRRQDLSGRGTWVPDTTLGMDEVGLPEEMGWDMYRPFVTKELIRRGYSAMKAKEFIDDKHPVARDLLLQETKNRPVLINRAPSLYRYNVLAAYPKLVPGKTIRVHEMLAPIQSGDFDGDAVQVMTPVSDAAVSDARKMTLPHMLLSDQEKFTLTKAAPQQEAVTGLYLATSAKAKGATKTFASKAEAMAAYNRGEIDLSTPVEIKS